MITIVFLSTFVIYLKTLLHYPLGSDIGELMTASLTLGIAHPPGYPLYILLGKLTSLIIPLGTPAEKINLLSSLSTSFSAVFLYLIIKKLTNSKLVSLSISLSFAFTENIWYYSLVSEPYNLAILFSAIIIYLAVQNKLIPFIFFLLSASTGVHLQTFVITPVTTVYLLLSNKNYFKNTKNIIFCIILFFLGFSSFLYIPIRAKQNPPVNYNNPVNFEKFKELVTAEQFKGFAFSAHKSDQFVNHAIQTVNSISKEFTPLIFIPFTLGVFFLTKQKKVFFLIFFSFVLSLFTWLDYAVYDFNRYLGTSYLLFFIIVSIGLPKKISFFYIALPLLLIFNNFAFVDQSKNDIPYQTAKETLAILEPNAVLLSYWQESGIYWYLTFVEKFRSDVTIIDDRNMINMGLSSYPQTAEYFLNQNLPFYTLKGFNRVNETRGQKDIKDFGNVVKILP